jgi:hypothetical protein
LKQLLAALRGETTCECRKRPFARAPLSAM